MSALSFPTLADAQAADAPTILPDYVHIEGYSTPGNGGETIYKLQRDGQGNPLPITAFLKLDTTNLFVNGTFNGGDTSGWELGTNFIGANNRLYCTNPGGETTTPLALKYGKRYRLAYGATRQAGSSQVTFIRSTTPNSGYPQIRIDGDASSNISVPYPDITIDYPGTWEFVIAPIATWAGYFDNFTCYEVIDQGQQEIYGYAYLPMPIGARLDLSPTEGGYLRPEMFTLDDTGTGFDDAAFARMFNRADALGGNVGIEMPGRYRREHDGYLRAVQPDGNIRLDAQEPGDWGVSAALWVTPDAEDAAPGLTAFADFLIAHGGNGYVPAGTYRISAGWQFRANNGDNQPFRITLLPGTVIECDFSSPGNFVSFWEVNNFEVVGLNISGRASITGFGNHGISVRNCSNWRFLGKTRVTDWATAGPDGGGAGFMCYASLPVDDLGTYHHGYIEDIEVIAGPQGAGLGVLIDSTWYVDVMKAYAEGIINRLGYAFEYKDSCRHCKFHSWRAKDCKYAMGYGQESAFGAQYADFGPGEAVNCQNIVLVDNAQYCSIGPVAISVDPSRSDDDRFIRIGGAARYVIIDGLVITSYPATHTYPIYIEGSDNNSVRVTQITGATKYWQIVSGEQNRIIIETDPSREESPSLATFAAQSGDSADNVARVDVLGTQWWRDGNALLLDTEELSPNPGLTRTLGTISRPWGGLFTSHVDIIPAATEPPGVDREGMIGASNGAPSSDAWGAAGAGLYRWDDTARSWRYLAGPRTPVILGQSGAALAPLTGTTTETTLATITVPAGWMGNNGALRITTLWTVSNTANIKRARVRFGGTQFGNFPVTTSVTVHLQTTITNRGVASSQVSHPESLGAFGTNGNPVATGSIDTGANRNVTITGQLSATGDMIKLESYTVELLPAP